MSLEISEPKVRAMSRVATLANEDYLLIIAKHGTAAHVETVVRGYRRAKADLELEQANSRHQRRELHWYFDDDDTIVVTVRLTPEDGAHFIKAIERATLELQAERNIVGNGAGNDAGNDVGSGTFEETTPRNNRADALMHATVGATDTRRVSTQLSPEG